MQARAGGFDGSVTNITVEEVGQNWVLANNVGSSTNISDTLNIVTDGVFTQAAQNNVTIGAKAYKLQYTVLESDGGNLGFIVTGNQTDSIPSTVGTHTHYFVAHSTAIVFKRFSGALDVSISNIIVQEVGQEWVLSSGCTITDKGARILSDGTYQSVSQLGALVIGDTYEVEYEITEYVSGVLQVTGSFVGINLKTTLGVHKFYAVAGSSALTIKRGTACDITVDNIKIKRLTGDDTPRIDYTDGGCPVLLTEPQSTNLLTDSNDFSKWTLGVGITVEGGYLSPDGTNNAYKISGNDSALTRGATSETGTRTIYARTVSGTGLAHLCSYNGNTDNLFTITEDWQRFEVNAVISTGGTNFYAIDFRGSTTLTEILLYGAQVEELSYPTSYIPTYGAVRTRLQDSVLGAGTSSDFNSEEGVLFFEGSALADDLENRFITISNGTTTEGIRFYYSNASQRFRARYYIGNAAIANFSYDFTDVTQLAKIAFKWKVNDFALWVNGVEVQSSNVGAVHPPNTFNNMELAIVGAAPFFGKTSQIQVFKTALSDHELELLTTDNVDYASYATMASFLNYNIS